MALRKYETRQCDRCGKEIELQVEPQSWQGWRELRTSRFTSLSEEERLPPRADLCPDCVKGLAEWWQKFS